MNKKMDFGLTSYEMKLLFGNNGFKKFKWKVLKYIPGYNRRYSIHREGKVWSKAKKRGMNTNGKWLKESCHKNGYLQVRLYKDGKAKAFYIHRLVAEAFLPNPHGFKCIKHKDGNKHNNHVMNLEWTSQSLIQRSYKDSMPLPNMSASFLKDLRENHSDEIIRLREQGETIRSIMKRYMASRYQIQRCLAEWSKAKREEKLAKICEELIGNVDKKIP